MVVVNGVEIGNGIPKICVPITGKTSDEILEEGSMLRGKEIDLVEWRVDFFEEVEEIDKVLLVLDKLKTLLDIPIIFTFRREQEGGVKKISETYYLYLNKVVAESKLIHIIDIELFHMDVAKLVAIAHQNDIYTIISNHDFEQTPSKEEISNRLMKMQELGGDIAKIAVMPSSTSDVLSLMDITNEMVEKLDIPIVTMSMSKKGLISRLVGEIMGSAITFGTARKSSAPGQIPIKELREVLNIIHKYS